MSRLECNKRDESIKNKRLRREGFVPGIVYGKNLDESIKVQIDAKKLSELFKTSNVGSQLSVVVDGEEINTIIKLVEYMPMSSKYQHIDFQVLTSGEKIKTSVPIKYINKENIQDEGIVQEYFNALEYEVLPKDMMDTLEIDLSVLSLANDIKVSDLELVNDERYHILTASNSVLVSLAPIQEVILEAEDEDAEDEVETVVEEEATEE